MNVADRASREYGGGSRRRRAGFEQDDHAMNRYLPTNDQS
jgi:hypothetical protein